MANNVVPQLPGYDTLSKMYVAPMSGMLAEQNYGLARQFAEQDYAKTAEELKQTQLLNPIKVKQEEATLDKTLTQNRTLKREEDFNASFDADRRAAEVRSWALKASEDDQKMALSAAEAMMRNPDPKIAAQGQKLRAMFSDVWTKDRESATKHKQKLEELAVTGKTQKEVASIYASRPTSTASVEKYKLWNLINTAKGANAKLQIIDTALADPNTDPEDKERLAAIRPGIAEHAQVERNTEVKPNDFSQVPGPDGKPRWVRTPPQQVPAAPVNLPANPATQGRPARQAETERVRVQNPNGQTGTIPRSQLPQALAKGWKEVK